MVYDYARGKAAKITAKHPLYEVISQAYQQFAGYEPGALGVCEGCCMQPEIEADFFGPAIEKLPLYYLYDWYFAATLEGGVPRSTWGYLLPRILEVLALGETVNGLSLEPSLARFPTGSRAQWSEAEWQVLDGFRHRYLAHLLRLKSGGELDEALCMFWKGGWPLAELLAQVAACEDAVLLRRLWQDWFVPHDPGLDGISVSAFWEGAAREEIVGFYTSPSLSARFRALAEARGTGPKLAAKARAVAVLIEAKKMADG